MTSIQKPKPVTVLTGFLGAGKTTLLNAILQRKNTRFAIIENEVGEIGIDGELIIKNTDSFTELNNGCICCSINDNFTDTLRKLTQRDDWDELLIEATGIANPGGIIAPFKQFPWLQKYFEVPNVICIVDAQNIEEQLKVSETAVAQLAYANSVYVSKMDLIVKDKLQTIESKLKRLNPFAKIYAGSRKEIPITQLMQKQEVQFPDSAVEREAESHHHHAHEYNAISLVYSLDFDEDKLFSRLYTFLMLQSSNVYRFKGIFYDPKNPKKLIIQSVMKTLLIEEGEEWQEGEKRESKFVFIGKGLKKEGFDKMLTSCRI